MAKKKKRRVSITKRKRRPVSRKQKPKRVVKRKRAPKRKTVKRKRVGRRVAKQIERRSVEKVIVGKRRRRRRGNTRRKVVMAGSYSRRRSVGAGGNKGLLIGLGIGAVALYFLTRPRTTTYPTGYTLPPLTQTANLQRNTQSSNIVNYAVAGGLAIDAIIKLIDRLNESSDQEVENIYDHVNTTGDVGVWV